MLLFPLLLAQRFSVLSSIQLGSLFLSLRHRRQLGDETALKRVDLSSAYLVVCLLAAGTAVVEDAVFFPVIALITGVALFEYRSRRYPLWVWSLVLGLVMGLGYVGQLGVRIGQGHLEDWVVELLEGILSAETDPSHLTTAIGHIGRLKFSDKILWQVRADDPSTIPPLLPRAMFQRYAFGGWSATSKKLQPVELLSDGKGWVLGKGKTTEREGNQLLSLEISGTLRNGEGILPLPAGATILEDLLAEEVRRNSLGTLVVEGSPEFIRYRVDFDPTSSGFAPPEEVDLELSDASSRMVQQTAEELMLANLSGKEAVQAIEDFFANGFRYSLFRRDMRYDIPPLSEFLLHSRKGHCEYFATSTVLLLRAAGIPSRYVSGYAVMEYSNLTDSFLIRKRHAHAWAIAYVEGRWISADFTPSIWAEEEEGEAPWWGGIADLWTIMSHAIQLAAMQQGEEQDNKLYYMMVLILIGILAWRLYRRPQRQKLDEEVGALEYPVRIGLDSPFGQVIQRFAVMELGPRKGETGRFWLARLERMGSGSVDTELMHKGLALHYRKRFDPKGLNREAEDELQDLVGEILRQVDGKSLLS